MDKREEVHYVMKNCYLMYQEKLTSGKTQTIKKGTGAKEISLDTAIPFRIGQWDGRKTKIMLDSLMQDFISSGDRYTGCK